MNMIKKGLAVAVILLFIGMCVVPSAGTITKEPYEPLLSGNTLYVGGNGTGNYTTIQSAIDDAYDGDTVFVYDESSPYLENVVVDKSIVLKGENKFTTIIEGANLNHAVSLESNGIEISGFQIVNFVDWQYSSLIVKTDNNDVFDNYFVDNRVAIAIMQSKSNIIRNNTIIGTNNDYRVGISIYGSMANKVIQNEITGVYTGIRIRESSIFNTVEENRIINNFAHGISITKSLFNKISFNTIEDTNGGWGIILFYSLLNIIKSNNFIRSREGNAHFNLCFGNRWVRNYWDDYDGTGIYIILGEIGYSGGSWFNFDWNPASEPYDIGV